MKKFKDEYDYLLHLVRCVIHNKQPEEIPAYLSFKKIFEYAVSHEIANIAFLSIEKLNKKPTSDLYNKWLLKYNQSISRDINQSYARQEILEEFKKAKIRSLEVQGTKIKEIYPKPEYRTMSDIDFIIDYSNLDKAKDIMLSLGYKCRFIDGVELDAYRAPNIFVEIHTEFFSKNSRFCGYMDKPFTNTIESVECSCETNPDVFYLYSILHIAKHYFNKGCGIRRVLDVYFLKHKYNKLIDKEYLDEKYKEAGILQLAIDLHLLAEYWFGNEQINKDLTVIEKHFKDSEVHGSMDIKISNRLSKYNLQWEKQTKIRYLLKRIFPDINFMCSAYPIVKKNKYLLYPVLLVYRILNCFFSGRLTTIYAELKAVIKAKFKKDYFK